jgi:hypothetical protein
MAETLLRWKAFLLKYANVIFFVGGFLFDALTLVRIDSTLDLVIQAVYLLLVTLLIDLKMRVDHGRWKPTGLLHKWWEYESEALHFFYGGLLSAYVIFYFKSTTFSRSLFFWALVAVLLFANEMPQLRRAGSMMRLGLYAFCVVSFLNYLLPVLIGRMGGLIFIAGWLSALVITAALVKHLSKLTSDPRRFIWRYSWSPAVVLLLVAGLYAEKLIPPVPLSMQYAGVFRTIEREGDKYKLTYEKPSFYAFWRKDNRNFAARPGDQIVFFTRVFAPRRFTHQIYIHWYKKMPDGQWVGSDRIPLSISGGRDQGFHSYTIKSHYDSGVWRADVETEDGRTLGGVKVIVTEDASVGERTFKDIRM